MRSAKASAGAAAYSFDDVAVAPSRRTRDPEDVSLAWQIDAYQFAHPIVAAPMDSVVSPSTVKQFADAGGLAVLNLEGLWTRYADPSALYDEIAAMPLDGRERAPAGNLRCSH